MFDNASLFGFVSENPVDRAAYDMMVLDQMERDNWRDVKKEDK